jgi:very-short-patch-repair endonuclease
MKCVICGYEGSDECGAFTRHLRDVHHITRQEYVVISEYGGIAPICGCGYCSETPEYYRGVFRKYAKKHNTFEWRNDNYTKQNNPKCIICGEPVGFLRDVPKKLCDSCISKEGYGFSSSLVQSAIVKSIHEKYGVDNVMKVDGILGAHLKTVRKIVRNYTPTEETKKKNSVASVALWKSTDHRNKTIPRIIEGVRKPSEIKRRREYVLDRILNEPDYLTRLISYSKCSNRLSKLHLRAREILNLSNLGFQPEVPIFRYVADDLHVKSKTIVEINGDYIHANPEIYGGSEEIITHQGRYLAVDKWKYDENRKMYLESKGYTVIVVWERDLKNQNKVAEIKQIIEESVNKAN